MNFRAQLLVAMALVALTITGVGLLVVERKVAAETEHDLELSVQAELNALHRAQEVRQAALAERCRALAGRPRILAALEDNARDLLYPSAKDELRDLLTHYSAGPALLRARFYRFLDSDGHVLPGDASDQIGPLTRQDEVRLALKSLPETPQIGFAWHTAGQSLVELFAMPVRSSESGEIISALIVGFEPSVAPAERGEMLSGLYLDGAVHNLTLDAPERSRTAEIIASEIRQGKARGNLPVVLNGKPLRLFFNLLNPGSAFPPAYEVCLFPLDMLLARQQTLRLQAAGICGVLLLVGVIGSQILSRRLAQPVEKLEVDSAENLAQRQKAEAALELTSLELQRAARFSADASHQLKTPVTVLRAGLDELLAREELSADTREEVSALLHQTFRLNTIIEDLLLLSRMDAGRLKLDLEPVNLTEIVEAWIDDFSTLSNVAIEVETHFTCDDLICGEKRYTTIIVENLLENARKYNRPGGRIRVSTRRDGAQVVLQVGNNGRTIAPESQEHIFERFHRGTAGENVPGYGLGLNLARELARLHGGELRLVSSAHDWTEFQVGFCSAQSAGQGKGRLG